MLLQIAEMQLIAPVTTLATLEHFEFLQLEQGENFTSEINKNYNSRIEWHLVQAVAEARAAKSGILCNVVYTLTLCRGWVLLN